MSPNLTLILLAIGFVLVLLCLVAADGAKTPFGRQMSLAMGLVGTAALIYGAFG